MERTPAGTGARTSGGAGARAQSAVGASSDATGETGDRGHGDHGWPGNRTIGRHDLTTRAHLERHTDAASRLVAIGIGGEVTAAHFAHFARDPTAVVGHLRMHVHAQREDAVTECLDGEALAQRHDADEERHAECQQGGRRRGDKVVEASTSRGGVLKSLRARRPDRLRAPGIAPMGDGRVAG